MGRRGGRPRHRPRARRRSALQHGNHAAGGLRRQDGEDHASDLGHLRGLLRLRRQGRHQAEDLPDLRRPGQGARAQGFFALERTCPTCQGRGQIIDNPCAGLLRLRPRDARADAVGQYSGRRRGRHPHPARGRGRGRAARRPARRSLHFPVGRPHAFFQRDGADLHCRVPISMVHRGAWAGN